MFGLEQEKLALIAADGTIQVWNWKENKLVKKWQWEWTEEEKNDSFGKTGSKKLPRRPAPSALAFVPHDGQNLAVAFQNAVVKLYRADTGEFVKRLAANETNGEL